MRSFKDKFSEILIYICIYIRNLLCVFASRHILFVKYLFRGNVGHTLYFQLNRYRQISSHG